MLYVVEGKDFYLVKEKLRELESKYKSDDFNYEEFLSDIPISDLKSSMIQTPMIADYYYVYLEVTKKQWTRLKEYFVPSELTVLVILLKDFKLTDDLREGVNIDEVFDCTTPRGRELTTWIKKRLEKVGYTLDKEDIRYIALLSESLKDIDDLLYQLSFLNDYDKRIFISEAFKSRQQFVWKAFVDLVNGKRRSFFAEMANQQIMNLGITRSQFNMKFIGGLLFCLNNVENAPGWIQEGLEKYNKDIDVMHPFLYVELLKILNIAKEQQDSVLVLKAFKDLFDRFKK